VAGLLATGAFGAVPFALETTPAVGVATMTVAVVRLYDPTPVALETPCEQRSSIAPRTEKLTSSPLSWCKSRQYHNT